MPPFEDDCREPAESVQQPSLKEQCALMLRAIASGDLSELEPEVRAAVEKQPADMPSATPAETVDVLRLGPNVRDLLASLAKAAGVRKGEWPKWLAAAQAADATGAERAKSPAVAPPPVKTAKAKQNGSGLLRLVP